MEITEFFCLCLKNFEGKRTLPEEIDIDDLPMEEDLPKEDYDHLDEYSFSKFASMYFQGVASPTHIRQRIQQPLLYHEDEGDVLVRLPCSRIHLLSCCVVPPESRGSCSISRRR